MEIDGFYEIQLGIHGGCMSSHELNREGRKIVEAELLRRGAASVTSSGTRKILLHATNASDSRMVEIKVKVKSKRKGNWHTRSDEGKPTDTIPDLKDVCNYWVFVVLDSTPRYWIVPDWWIRNNIHDVHQQYLKKHGGHRPVNDNSNHHSIDENRLELWEDKWDTLGIF